MSDTLEPPAAKKPKVHGEELAELKENLRKRKKILQSIPRLRLLDVGENAILNENTNDEDRIPIFLTDVQHLLMYSMLGNNATYLPERWCKLDKHNKVSHAVVFIVEGLSIGHYVAKKSLFQYLNTKSEYKLELITPMVYGGSLIEELAAIPLSGTQKRKMIKEFGSLEEAAQKNGSVIKLFKTIFPMKPEPKPSTDKTESKPLPTTDKFSRTELILSPWQLIEENYPIPLKGGLAKKYADYILTKDEYTEVTPKSKMYGIDCEMCKTTQGVLELTRISIVDEQYNVVYDTLVKPDNKITDYLTQYSGITEWMLEKVTTKLSDVQKFIRAFIPSNAILVGQSLNSDLHAMKMMHPYVIDTSVIFNLTGDRYRKTKLKVLAREFLDEKIQKGRSGHCSTEDSIASVKLVKLKLANSIHYGDSVLIEQSYANPYESQFRWTNNAYRTNSIKEEKTCTLGSLVFNQIAKIDAKTAGIFGCAEVMNEYCRILKNCDLSIMEDKSFEKGDNVRLVLANSNKDAVTRCSQVALEHALNFCHIKLNEDQLSESELEETVKSIDKWVKKLWKYTAVNGLFCVIFSGQQNSSNGVCFLNIKKNIDIDNDIK